MAAEPIPMPEGSTEVEIDANGVVRGVVPINNGGVVKFEVTSYKPGYNTCIVTIDSSNISWANSAIETENTIKVGNGGGALGHKR